MNVKQPHGLFAAIDWERITGALTYALFNGGNLPPGFMDKPAEVKRASYALPISRELALDAGLVEPTPAERAENERRAAETRRREVERAAALEAARGQLSAITDPLARRILDLHAENDDGECTGCDFQGYEAESPDWPCSTVENVAAHYGITLEPL